MIQFFRKLMFIQLIDSLEVYENPKDTSIWNFVS